MNEDRIIWENWFSIIIPSDWECSQDEEISIFKDDGVGVLQFSLIHRDKINPVEEADILNLFYSFCRSKGWPVFPKNEIILNWSDNRLMLEFEYEEKEADTFWKIYYFLSLDKCIFTTYNCGVDDKTIEIKVIQKIIDSFQWENEDMNL
ncbi:hypothetical protein LPTSP3_g13920 [Leptospira kobayashii]|uniref:Uncharacterized protein n=1 Tax=Leptospira kobayashii TaxID=1917830 RepID=A0ABN6KG40_9LEPT|nr:hypothetical protein [Leptospira kobayashii]BDA78462.1 hypothetical protein LPTSP3_g13920 [Leptospira kobayashii]